MKPSSYLTNYQWVVDTDPARVLTLDFETYYDSKTFSLKNLSMEEYIRDPRFMVHGVGVQLGHGEARWIYGYRNVSLYLAKAPLDQLTVVCHNAKFDGLILSQIFNVFPKAFMDTQAMAPLAFGNNLNRLSLAALTRTFLPGLAKDSTPLHNTDGLRVLTPEIAEELGTYCKMDCYLTHELYKFFLPWLSDSPLNADLIDNVIRMFTDPVLKLNPAILNRLLATEITEKQAALDASLATSTKQLNSNPQFATLLESQGVQPPMKPSPANPSQMTYAFAKTDREFIALQTHINPAVVALVKARLRVKTNINETRATKYLGVESRGTWPVDLVISGARTTHRLSGAAGGGGNPQNLGNKSPLRYAIEPPAGYAMLVIDSSNIDMRVAMTIAHERETVTKLRDPEFDQYKQFAATAYQRSVESIGKDSVERKVGKVACLQLQYGAGWENFQQVAWQRDLTLDDDEAKRLVGIYRSTFTGITRTWKVCDRIIAMLLRDAEEETWFDNLVRPVVNGPRGQPGLLLVETGTYITYPNLKKEYDEDEKRWNVMYDTFDNKTYRLERTKLYGSKMFGHICQSLARNVVLEQQVAVDTFLKKEISFQCKTTMSVHDETVPIIPLDADLEAAKAGAIEIFNTSPAWWPELPVFSEASYGANYGAAK